jgi:hypothetical protein
MLWSDRRPPKSGSQFSHCVLVPTLLFVQIFAFVGDGYLGHKNLPANLVSTFRPRARTSAARLRVANCLAWPIAAPQLAA